MSGTSEDKSTANSRPWWADLLLVLAGGGLLYGLAAWLIVTDKQRVDRLIDRGLEALERQDVEECVSLVAERCAVKGDGGSEVMAGPNEIRGMLQALFQEFGKLRIKVKKRSVVVSEGSARASFVTVLFLSSRDLPSVQQELRVRGVASFRKTGPEDWRLDRLMVLERKSGAG
ncbi:MAG: nuclear transport factor 2 family protein [Candidatus Riflebacteria bacterium]|nr:nuclear transport factor 2 family protein [Candidatus Riflebacteria bacterium]